MERLTRWNGKQYTLPQGKTSDGKSYWRMIADKLAEHENNDASVKELRYGFTDLMMPIDNQRIETLVRIWNRDCERIVERWLNEADWAISFGTHKSEHWWVVSQSEQATAMYFMGLVPTAEMAGRKYIYNMIKAEVEKRKAVIK